MKKLAEATDKVAYGNFSVYVPPLHIADELDYLDVMLMDCNCLGPHTARCFL